MSDHKVAGIRPDVVLSEGKQHLLDTIASAYDQLATDAGEPVALVFALVTESGAARTGYHTLSAIDGRNALHIARGIQCLNIDQHLWDGAFR